MYEPSGGGPNPNPHDPNLAADHIPPDPLLEPGTFIDTNTNRSAQNGNVQHPDPTRNVRSESEEGRRTRPVADFTTTTATAGETLKSRRPRRAPEDVAAMAERPDWLPNDWKMEVKVRSTGVSAGSVDRYYVEPAQGGRFRSKNEVLHFLETGSKLKRKTADADGPSSDIPGSHKEKKSAGPRAKKPAPAAWTFDFNNPPSSVRWILTDVFEDQWTPSIGDKKVPESTKREWATVFDRLRNSKK